MLSQLTIGRVVKVNVGISDNIKQVIGHVVGFGLNCTGETIVVVQVPKYASPTSGKVTVGDWTETFATHLNNVSILLGDTRD